MLAHQVKDLQRGRARGVLLPWRAARVVASPPYHTHSAHLAVPRCACDVSGGAPARILGPRVRATRQQPLKHDAIAAGRG